MKKAMLALLVIAAIIAAAVFFNALSDPAADKGQIKPFIGVRT